MEMTRLTLSQQEEGESNQPREILLRQPDKSSPCRLRSSSLTGPGSEMHHLKHLWHTIQILPVHMSITDEGESQLLRRGQLIEPRVHRLGHIFLVSQTELSNVVKVLILVAHDYIS